MLGAKAGTLGRRETGRALATQVGAEARFAFAPKAVLIGQPACFRRPAGSFSNDQIAMIPENAEACRALARSEILRPYGETERFARGQAEHGFRRQSRVVEQDII